MAKKKATKTKATKKKAEPRKDSRLNLKGGLPTSDERNYTARGLEGRDGTGPCEVAGEHTAVMLPNGDLAKAGDTFDPIVEQMSPARFRSLLSGKHIKAPKDYEDKLLKSWDTKSDGNLEGDDGIKTDAGEGDEEK